MTSYHYVEERAVMTVLHVSKRCASTLMLVVFGIVQYGRYLVRTIIKLLRNAWRSVLGSSEGSSIIRLSGQEAGYRSWRSWSDDIWLPCNLSTNIAYYCTSMHESEFYRLRGAVSAKEVCIGRHVSALKTNKSESMASIQGKNRNQCRLHFGSIR
jgi:hypothetical protein